MDNPILDGAGPLRQGQSLDDLIMAVARHRDRAAFATLFAFFAPRLKSYLARAGCDPQVAEEIVQDAMVTVWRRAETFDPAHAGASTWVFTIARNKRIDRLRRERRPAVDPDDPAMVPDPPAAADRTIETAQDADRLREAVALLPDEQRDLLHMAFFEDKPHSAIAAIRDLPLGTVKSRIRLALARLRRDLGDDR